MKRIVFLTFLITGFAFGQKINFTYDAAGNQTLRTLCFGCLQAKTGNETINEYSKITDKELQKFYPEDVISYYPNPVLDELFIKWELTENTVKDIVVFNVNGQVLKTLLISTGENSQTLNFSQYPTGVYFVNLDYTTGDAKTIKIIKN